MRGAASAAYGVISILSYLLILREVSVELGLSALGIFSLIFTISTAVRVFDFSGAKAIYKFFSLSGLDGDERINNNTVLITMFAIPVNIILALLTSLIIYTVINGETNINHRESIMQLSLLGGMFTLSSASVQITQSLFDCIGWSVFRSVILSLTIIASTIAIITAEDLSISYILVMQITLIGGTSLFLIAWLIFLSRWRPNSFSIEGKLNDLGEILSFSMRLSLSQILTAAFDPLLRTIIFTQVGPGGAGFYELIVRPLSQTRRLLTMYVNPYLPALVRQFQMAERTSAGIEQVIQGRINKLIFIIGCGCVPFYIVYLNFMQQNISVDEILSIFLAVPSFLINLYIFIKYQRMLYSADFAYIYLAHAVPIPIALFCILQFTNQTPFWCLLAAFSAAQVLSAAPIYFRKNV